MPLQQKITAAITAILSHTDFSPEIGIILGTGLGALAEEIEAPTIIGYENIPGFPVPTVESHRGRLIFGELSGRRVMAMQGRFHYYEGYTMQETTFPVRVMQALGVRTLVVSNACGGMNPQFQRGDVMIIEDHINLIGANPLIGPNDSSLGPRFPDMSEPYSKRLIGLGLQGAVDAGFSAQIGTYVAVAGPNLETRAEYRFLRTIGADAVGMSTVPEVIVARHAGMQVFGISIITDECFPDTLQPANIEEIIAAATEAEPRMAAVVKSVVAGC